MSRTKVAPMTPVPEPPENQAQDVSSLLVRVQKLEQRIRQRQYQPDSSPLRFKEYNLTLTATGTATTSTGTGTLSCLKDFVDLYGNDQAHDYYRYIWRGDALIRLEGSTLHTDNGLRSHIPQRYGLRLRAPNGSSLIMFIYSAEEGDAVDCLGYLLGLNDEYYSSIRVYSGQPLLSIRQNAYTDFPLAGSLLNRVLENEARELVFDAFAFSNEQCRALFRCEGRSQLTFHSCRITPFEQLDDDDVSPNGKRRGPVKLSLHLGGSSADTWINILNGNARTQQLEYLGIHVADITDAEACQAVATASIDEVCLQNVGMVDNGDSLIASLMEGRGPKALSISGHLLPHNHNGLKPFGSLAQWRKFLNGLRGNSHLERLTLCVMDLGIDEWLTLAGALKENKGLVCLTIANAVINETCWDELLVSISEHPNLRELNFKSIMDSPGGRQNLDEGRQRRTQRLVKLLRTNGTALDTMRYDSSTYDQVIWDRLVHPILNRNLHRKRFEPIQNIEPLSFRASLIGAAFGRVRTDPSLIWMLLSMNQDIIAERRLPLKQESSDPDGSHITTRKRSLSPCFDSG